MTFSIYNGPTGGTPLWTETLDVAVTNGVFAVELGKVTPMPAALVGAPSLFLEQTLLSVLNCDTIKIWLTS